MDKIIYLIFPLLLLHTNSTQDWHDRNMFTIVFVYDTFTEVNFTKRTIKNEYFKYPDNIRLSVKEEKMIEQSFNRNQIAKMKGNIVCVNDTIAVSPSPSFEVKLFKNRRLLSTILVDYFYSIESTNKSSKEFKSANFVSDLRKILENNNDFKKSIDALHKYENKNHLLRL